MSARRAMAALLLASFTAAPVARAQSFAPAAPAGPQPGAFALLERALVEPGGAFALEAAATRWFALDALATRALAVTGSARSFAGALGVAQTGDAEYGWSEGALALASAGESGAFALRVAARHERRDGALARAALARTAAFEAGAGGALALGGPWRAWASAPQCWSRGDAPPLARPLELGVRAAGEDGAVWAALEAPRAGLDGARLVGAAIVAGPLRLWTEARDGPWRASIGLEASHGAWRMAARVDAHPELPETTRLAFAFAPRRAGAR